MHSRLQGRPQYARKFEVILRLLFRPFRWGLLRARHLWLRSDFQVSAALEYFVTSPAREFDLSLSAHVRFPRFTSIGFRARFRCTDDALSHHEIGRPNKAPEPTPGPVTSRADWAFEMISSRKARLAPGPVVAHL